MHLDFQPYRLLDSGLEPQEILSWTGIRTAKVLSCTSEFGWQSTPTCVAEGCNSGSALKLYSISCCKTACSCLRFCCLGCDFPTVSQPQILKGKIKDFLLSVKKKKKSNSFFNKHWNSVWLYYGGSGLQRVCQRGTGYWAWGPGPSPLSREVVGGHWGSWHIWHRSLLPEWASGPNICCKLTGKASHHAVALDCWGGENPLLPLSYCKDYAVTQHSPSHEQPPRGCHCSAAGHKPQSVLQLEKDAKFCPREHY